MDKRSLGEQWWRYRYWISRSKTWELGTRTIILSVLRPRQFWGGEMTKRTTMAFMAAVLFLSVQVQPRAQTLDGEVPSQEIEADCPCGDPVELVPIAAWPTKVVDCAADPRRAALYGFSFEGGVASLTSTIYGRDCQFVVDATGLNSQERPISQPQVNACSVLILSYAQALKDGGQVAVSDFGCNLR